MPPEVENTAQSTQVNAPSKRSRLLIAVASILILVGGLLYALHRKGVVSVPALGPTIPEEQFADASDKGVQAQLQGDYAGAKLRYAESLKNASDEEEARVRMRIAFLDTLGKEPTKGVVALRELSEDTSTPADIRARSGLVALQAYANTMYAKTTPEARQALRDGLFAGSLWSAFYPEPRDEEHRKIDDALLAGYEHVLTIGDPFYAHYLAARILAQKARAATGEERAALAERAKKHLFAGNDSLAKPENTANWPESYIAIMRLEGARAMVHLYALVADKTIAELTLTKEAVLKAYEDVTAYATSATTWDTDPAVSSSALIARLGYMSFSSAFPEMNDETGAQASTFIQGYKVLSAGGKVAFNRDAGFLRAVGDETIYADDALRQAVIRIAGVSSDFKTFLIDNIDGWDENDFK